jgi:hypothetical protein
MSQFVSGLQGKESKTEVISAAGSYINQMKVRNFYNVVAYLLSWRLHCLFLNL